MCSFLSDSKSMEMVRLCYTMLMLSFLSDSKSMAMVRLVIRLAPPHLLSLWKGQAHFVAKAVKYVSATQ